MGTANELGYALKDPNTIQRVSQRYAASRFGSWLNSKYIHRVDPLLFRLSKGRVTLASLIAGFPVVMFTTTGRKSGAPRTMPLLAIPIADDLAVIGSNSGQPETPGWVYNLEADPMATVAFRDATIDVRARRATEAESDDIFAEAAKIYRGYAHYRQRAEHRTIRVFVLESPS
jgi:deazaflavin-dependent oxidoreductase (nitroreductase family)